MVGDRPPYLTPQPDEVVLYLRASPGDVVFNLFSGEDVPKDEVVTRALNHIAQCVETLHRAKEQRRG